MDRTLVLPSDQKEIKLKPFSVALAMEINSFSKSFPEHYITKFLSLIQPKDELSDPLKWTAQDRYFAMLDIYLNTFADTPEMLIEDMVYSNCHGCGKEHDVVFEYASLVGSLKELTRPLPKIKYKDKEYTLTPLTGKVMEEVEMWHYGIPEEIENSPKTDKEVQEILNESTRIAGLQQIIENTRVAAYLGKTVKDFEDMPYTDFVELARMIPEQIDKLTHGIKFEFMVGCKNKKGCKEVARPVPFRELAIISRI